MVRRPLRPQFSSTEEQVLLNALQKAPRMALKCGSAERYGSPRHARCEAVTQGIAALVEELTGRRDLLHA